MDIVFLCGALKETNHLEFSFIYLIFYLYLQSNVRMSAAIAYIHKYCNLHFHDPSVFANKIVVCNENLNVSFTNIQRKK